MHKCLKYVTSFDSVILLIEMRPEEMVGQVHNDSTINRVIPAQRCLSQGRMGISLNTKHLEK